MSYSIVGWWGLMIKKQFVGTARCLHAGAFAAVCCCLLLFAAVCCCLLLFSAVFCCFLLFSAVFCCFLLFSAVCCCLLLRGSHLALSAASSITFATASGCEI
jgi:hypothetical protein